jgi:hypothetical protein
MSENEAVNLHDLLECGDEYIQEQAEFILTMQKAFDEGALTEEEFRELLDDTARAFETEEMAGDMILKAKFIAGLYTIASIM